MVCEIESVSLSKLSTFNSAEIILLSTIFVNIKLLDFYFATSQGLTTNHSYIPTGRITQKDLVIS